MRKVVLALSLVLLPGMDLGLAGSAVAAPTAGSSTSGSAIVRTALRYLGYPYTTTGNSPSLGFSCIGFVSYVYGVNGIPLPDDLWDAMSYAPPVAFSDLQPGDILYFQNTVWAGLSHTAIYLGGGKFIQAEWYNRGVVISSFTNDPVDGNYWQEHYLGANRPWTGAAASGSLAASLSDSTSAGSPNPPLWNGPRARVQVPGLNVRTRPSLLAPIIRLATQGTALVVLKQYRTWDWVQLPNGSFGWVSGTAIGVRSASPRRADWPSGTLPLVTASVNGLHVHIRPNLGSRVVGTASRDQRLLVLNRWLGWLRVLLPDGTRGWIDGGLVSTGRAVQATKSSSVVKDHAPASLRPLRPTITATVRVHSRPGLRAPVLQLAAAGVRIRVFGTWRRWVYVRLPSGHTGWIYRAYVKRV